MTNFEHISKSKKIIASLMNNLNCSVCAYEFKSLKKLCNELKSTETNISCSEIISKWLDEEYEENY